MTISRREILGGQDVIAVAAQRRKTGFTGCLPHAARSANSLG
jgi:hypothetical protein